MHLQHPASLQAFQQETLETSAFNTGKENQAAVLLGFSYQI